MTNEEAIAIITEAIEDYVCNHVTDTAQAQRMLNAVQALEQEPCEDAISRQAVLETLDDMDNVLDEDRTIENYKELLKDCYEVLPPVKPQEKTGHWIYDNIASNWRCDKCGETPKTMGYVGTADFMAEHFKFCNHCGCRMVDTQESEVQE